MGIKPTGGARWQTHLIILAEDDKPNKEELQKHLQNKGALDNVGVVLEGVAITPMDCPSKNGTCKEQLSHVSVCQRHGNVRESLGLGNQKNVRATRNFVKGRLSISKETREK